MITNGTVSVEDGKKAIEEYAPARKVRVELSFTVDEGADYNAVLHDAATLADKKVKELLGQKASAAKGSADTSAAAAVITDDKPKTTRKKAAETLPPVESFPLDGAASTAQPKADEASIGDDILGGDPAAPKVDISDKALYDLVVSINAKVKKPKEITELITKFCPQDGVPPSLKRVPEGKRVEFIEAVKAFAASQK